MSDLISRFTSIPPYGIGGLVVLLLYAIQSEVRFGVRARTIRAGASDRNSTLAVSISAAVSVLGFALAVKAGSPTLSSWLPHWFREALVPGLPFLPWTGVAMGALGLGLRLWAVLTLRDRYTRTLLVQDRHTIERGGPYRRVRHPGYLGSLLCLNGIALASGNLATLIASLVATSAAYAYRIRVEDEMLVASLGADYADYMGQVRALLPFPRIPPGARTFLALRALAFVVLVPGTVAGYVPLRILRASSPLEVPSVSAASLAAAALLLVGTAVLLRCVWDFLVAGRGTLAPVDPPRRLVVRGLYRVTRNPMYNGVLAILFGEAWLFHSSALLRYAIGVLVLFHAVVVLYEEHALESRFGESYRAYRRAVPRWGFTLRPYTEPSANTG